MTEQEKLELVRESLQYVRECIKQTIAKGRIGTVSMTEGMDRGAASLS